MNRLEISKSSRDDIEEQNGVVIARNAIIVARAAAFETLVPSRCAIISQRQDRVMKAIVLFYFCCVLLCASFPLLIFSFSSFFLAPRYFFLFCAPLTVSLISSRRTPNRIILVWRTPFRLLLSHRASAPFSFSFNQSRTHKCESSSHIGWWTAAPIWRSAVSVTRSSPHPCYLSLSVPFGTAFFLFSFFPFSSFFRFCHRSFDGRKSRWILHRQFERIVEIERNSYAEKQEQWRIHITHPCWSIATRIRDKISALSGTVHYLSRGTWSLPRRPQVIIEDQIYN